MLMDETNNFFKVKLFKEAEETFESSNGRNHIL